MSKSKENPSQDVIKLKRQPTYGVITTSSSCYEKEIQIRIHMWLYSPLLCTGEWRRYDFKWPPWTLVFFNSHSIKLSPTNSAWMVTAIAIAFGACYDPPFIGQTQEQQIFLFLQQIIAQSWVNVTLNCQWAGQLFNLHVDGGWRFSPSVATIE